MGEKQNQSFQLSFNASLKIDFQGSRITSDGGLIRVRELDERLGFGELITQHLIEAQEEHPASARRSVPPVRLQSHSGLVCCWHSRSAQRLFIATRKSFAVIP
jgi:hypothetical protein